MEESIENGDGKVKDDLERNGEEGSKPCGVAVIDSVLKVILFLTKFYIVLCQFSLDTGL